MDVFTMARAVFRSIPNPAKNIACIHERTAP